MSQRCEPRPGCPGVYRFAYWVGILKSRSYSEKLQRINRYKSIQKSCSK